MRHHSKTRLHKIMLNKILPLLCFLIMPKSSTAKNREVLLNNYSEYPDISFNYIPVITWEDTKSMLLAGKADIRMPGKQSATPFTTLGYTNESIHCFLLN